MVIRERSDGGSAPRSLRACLRSPEKRQNITPWQRLRVEFINKI